MKASRLLRIAPGVCLWLLLLFPATAEPTPRALRINTFAFSAPSAEVLVTPAEPVVEKPAVHVVLTRGAQRLALDLPVDGRVSPETADAIARILSDPQSGRTRRIAAGTLVLLADVAARYLGHEIAVISAVRSEPDRSRAGVPTRGTGMAARSICRCAA